MTPTTSHDQGFVTTQSRFQWVIDCEWKEENCTILYTTGTHGESIGSFPLREASCELLLFNESVIYYLLQLKYYIILLGLIVGFLYSCNKSLSAGFFCFVKFPVKTNNYLNSKMTFRFTVTGNCWKHFPSSPESHGENTDRPFSSQSPSAARCSTRSNGWQWQPAWRSRLPRIILLLVLEL